MQGQYTTTTLQHCTAKQRRPEEKHAWAGVSRAKRAGRETEKCSGSGALPAQPQTGEGQTRGTEQTQSNFQGKKEGPHGQAAEEQQGWMETMEEWPRKDPLQEKPHIQVTDGQRARRRPNQPDTWRQVLMVVDEHRYLFAAGHDEQMDREDTGGKDEEAPQATGEAFWHAQRFRRNLVMASMDIRQCFNHMDNRKVIEALQARQRMASFATSRPRHALRTQNRR